MGNITAKLVKDLRDQTGAGMMDCKKALNETVSFEGCIHASSSMPKCRVCIY